MRQGRPKNTGIYLYKTMVTISTTVEHREKVIAAILAGVNAFMQDEKQVGETATGRHRPSLDTKIWPILGREEMMRMRTMWQRRMV